MSLLNGASSGTQQSLLRYVVGFFSVGAIILLLPKTLKFMIRKFLFGLIAEVITVVLAGLLTEKLVDQISRE